MLLSQAYVQIIRKQCQRLQKCSARFTQAVERGEHYNADLWHDEFMQALRIIDRYEIALSEIETGKYPDHEI